MKKCHQDVDLCFFFEKVISREHHHNIYILYIKNSSIQPIHVKQNGILFFHDSAPDKKKETIFFFRFKKK